eukprot:jgi/Mesvir1/5968/Mv00723-RA.2
MGVWGLVAAVMWLVTIITGYNPWPLDPVSHIPDGIQIPVEVPREYNTTSRRSGTLLNVHIVCHTHDDVGWLKTVDQYYMGSNNSIQDAGVQYILDSVVTSLLENPDRKFIYVEQAFFQRWWREQKDARRRDVERLVRNGQLEFINGGWCMHDEAAVHFRDMVDQTTRGHRFLMEQFGVTPRVGWQIDPFGHSAVQASLLSADVGFDALFFGRIDYADIAKRRKERTMEMVWRASKSLGADSQVFAGVLPNGYGAPDGFWYETVSYDPPIQDDPALYDMNVQERVDAFVAAALAEAEQYRGNDIIMTMGGDFNYQNANPWFKNLDKLIHYVNKDGRINVLYSTPSQYASAKHASNLQWPLKTDDFFPYADCPHCYWTGYFSSRPALKGYVRQLSGYLQAVRQLEHAVGKPPTGPSTETLEEAVAVSQHHDAVSGTSKQHVANDYAKRLEAGALEADTVFGQAVNLLTFKRIPGSATDAADAATHPKCGEPGCESGNVQGGRPWYPYDAAGFTGTDVASGSKDQEKEKEREAGSNRRMMDHGDGHMGAGGSSGMMGGSGNSMMGEGGHHGGMMDGGMMGKKPDSLPVPPASPFTMCRRLNESNCDVTSQLGANGTSLVVVAYNALGWSRSEIVHLPVPACLDDNLQVVVSDASGQHVPSQLTDIVPLPGQPAFSPELCSSARRCRSLATAASTRENQPSDASSHKLCKDPYVQDLAFWVETPPLGIATYFVELLPVVTSTATAASLPAQPGPQPRPWAIPGDKYGGEEEASEATSSVSSTSSSSSAAAAAAGATGGVVRDRPTPYAATATAASSAFVPKGSAQKSAVTHPSECSSPDVDSFAVSNGLVELVYSCATGLLLRMSNLEAGVSAGISQTIMWYNASDGNTKQNPGQAAGAYIMRTNTSEPFPVLDPDATVDVTVVQGELMQEVIQRFADWVTVVTRLYNTESHVEIEYTIGPVPTEDDNGKEVVSILTSSIHNEDKSFWTDSNGRDMIKRVVNHRDTWELDVTEPVAGNFYPVNSAAVLRDDTTQLSVLVDRAIGVGSTEAGQLQFLLHRRILFDDHRGVDEALNETSCGCTQCHCKGLVVRARHLLSLKPPAQGVRWVRERQQRNENPLHLLFAPLAPPLAPIYKQPRDAGDKTAKQPAPPQLTPSAIEAWKQQRLTSVRLMPEGVEMPANVGLLTLQVLRPGTSLVRLMHLYEVDEDEELSSPAVFDISLLFPSKRIMGIEELNLSANQLLRTMKAKRLTWKAEPQDSATAEDLTRSSSMPSVEAKEVSTAYTVASLAPFQIRTFQVTWK